MQDADKFLGLLANGEHVTFQTFDDAKVKRRTLSKVLHGDLEHHEAELLKLNDRGAGVFVMVNAGDLSGRKANNVKRVRAVFVDLDGSPLQPVLDGPLKPNLVVESSADRFHAYWLVNDLPLDEFRAVQELLAFRFDGDPKVKDLPRVMRLPGFMHRKNQPFPTHIINAEEDDPYQRADLMDAFGFDPASSNWKDSSPIREGQRNDTLFRMARGLVNKGFGLEPILSRLATVNEKRCEPPLEIPEIQEIVRQALKCGAGGALSIEYSIMDSAVYKALSPMARSLDMVIRRMTNGNKNAVLSLLPEDLAQWSFGNRKTLAKYRDELIDAGFLTVVREPCYGRAGETRECGLYRPSTPGFMANLATKNGGFCGTPYPPNSVHSIKGGMSR